MKIAADIHPKSFIPLILTGCFFCMISLKAQEYSWNADLWNIADNREYFNDFQDGETILGSRINGLLRADIDSIHQISAGLSYLYEYGDNIDTHPLRPILYYHYKRQPMEFIIGSFPRHAHQDYPNILLQDRFGYYHPTMQGLYAKTYNKHFHQTIWVDWLQKQAIQQREEFMYGGSGHILWRRFFLEHHFLMMHQAKSLQPASENIRDNGGLIARLGIQLNPSKSYLDTFYLSIGPTVKADQLRGVYDFKLKSGLSSVIEVRKDWLGLKAHYFHNAGQEIIYGAPLYEARNYSRMDFYFDFFKHQNIEGRFEYRLHLINNTLDHSQQVHIRINLGQQISTTKQSLP